MKARKLDAVSEDTKGLKEALFPGGARVRDKDRNSSPLTAATGGEKEKTANDGPVAPQQTGMSKTATEKPAKLRYTSLVPVTKAPHVGGKSSFLIDTSPTIVVIMSVV